MKKVPNFLAHLYDENGISVIDTDMQGRPQTSLVYTMQLVCKCFDQINKFNNDVAIDPKFNITERELCYLVDAIGKEEPSEEREYKSEVYKKLKKIYKDFGKEKIRIQPGYTSMKSFVVFIDPSTKNAIATNIWEQRSVNTEGGERIIECKERKNSEFVSYIAGVSPIGTDLSGKIVEGKSMISVIQDTYSSMEDKKSPLDHKTAIKLLDQIPVDGERENGYRPSQRIIDLYCENCVVLSFSDKNDQNRNRIVWTYPGTDIAIIETPWDIKADGSITSNRRRSIIFTNLKTLDDLKNGKKSFLALSPEERLYHERNTGAKGKSKRNRKIKKAISDRILTAKPTAKWLSLFIEAKNYVERMNGSIDTNAVNIYEEGYSKSPYNLQDGKIEERIAYFRKQIKKGNYNEYQKKKVEKDLGDYSFRRIANKWNYKCVEAYMSQHDGQYPSRGKCKKLAIFISTEREVCSHIISRMEAGERLSKDEIERFMNMMKIGLPKRAIEETRLKNAMKNYYNMMIEKGIVKGREIIP